MTAATIAATAPSAAPSASPCSLRPLLRWVAEEPDPPDVELLCLDHVDGGRGAAGSVAVRLPGCLADVSVASYIELIAGGALSVVALVDGCARRAAVERSVAEARRLVRAAGTEARLECAAEPSGRRRRPLFELNSLPVSRRRLLMLAVPKRGATRSDDTTERGRTLAALRALSSGHESTLRALPAGSADLRVSGCTGCTGCAVCVKSCPASALELSWQRDEPPGAFQLLFTPTRCVDCGRCTQLCPQSALSREGALSWEALLGAGDRRLLASGRARSCARCHAPFTVDTGSAGSADGAYCAVCAFRIANPFGARRMAPGA